jgi:ABC-type nitrate/sulfonate/bicarbonate transport system ATPase subunit
VVDGLEHSYRSERGERVQALAGVSLRAAAGELLAVVGPSGCGKTTLLELLCALQRPERGRIQCPPAVLMPQRDLLLPWLDALDNAALALRLGGHSRARARARAQALFGELGLEGFERARPRELSGGMRQRVAFVRTLLSGKQLLCLDEPFGALDAITRSEMQQWLAGTLAREPRTVVFVTHDVEEAVLLADRLVVLSERPARVLDELEVTLPRPRRAADGELIALRARALQALSGVHA